ncbi:MAG: hypothetical protein FWG13_00795 [Leptospirales bacterium]|nr:hypothetical protein [Leptospirales bacterium]
MNEIRLIKNCPECGKQLRFPIDRGIIRVKCLCGYSFTLDPDDTGIYKDARFDLSANAGRGAQPSRKPPLKERVMRGIWQYRYNLQNISLLTGKARRNVIIVTALIVLFFLSILCLILILMTPPQKHVI